MDRKFTIFVSSPQLDLVEQREAVVKAILRLGHIPVGMEMFNAADESSWKLITRNIDESDFYVVILAHRYGSLDGDISYTEKEYDYAVAKGIPTFGFVIEKSAPWRPDLSDSDPAAKEKLDRFRAKIAAKQVSYWRTADDLGGCVLACLATQIPLASRPGWVRGTTIPGPAVADELSRLSRENAELRSQIGDDRQTARIRRLLHECLLVQVDGISILEHRLIQNQQALIHDGVGFAVTVHTDPTKADTPVDVQIGLVTRKCFVGADVGASLTSSNDRPTTVESGDSEITHIDPAKLPLLPGGWASRYFMLFAPDDLKPIYPEEIIVRIYCSAGTRDFAFSVSPKAVE